ncbi:MAG: DMT family transporter [Chloroflexi bacterium]|nr:DMT family transporter [Chloroflexota bacterium]
MRDSGNATGVGATYGYLFALGASASYGLAQVLTRYGVSQFASPLVGASISLLVGAIGLGLLSARELLPQLTGAGGRRGLLLFSLAGVTAAGGVVMNYIALSYAPVVIVSPVLGVNPLVTLFFAAIFLRSLERITPRLVFGSVLVVLGVLCITLATALEL